MEIKTYSEQYQYITEDNPWYIIKPDIDPLTEREQETLLAFGNGYIGTRNSLEEHYEYSDPATFVAGIYKPTNGTGINELVKTPDWTRIKIYIGNDLINLHDAILNHKRYLDLRRGIVLREWRSQDSKGRITNIKIIKFISLKDKHLAYKSLIIEPENYSDEIRVITGIDGNTSESVYPIPDIDLTKERLIIAMKPEGTDKLIIMSQISEFIEGSQCIPIIPLTLNRLSSDKESEISYKQGFKDNFNYEEWGWQAEYGQQYIINSMISVFAGDDNKETLKNSNNYLTKIIEKGESSCTGIIHSHVKSWNNHWEKINLNISGDKYAQKCVNYALYHLIQSGKFSGNNTSIPARNLSGESYQGHIFWDTEIFMLPFYIFTDPEVAKALLIYRYNTLQGARENSKREGFRGASFAWESTDTGFEMAPKEVKTPFGQVINIYTSEYENHISPDIAYAVWQYWQATHDEDFLLNYGSEIIFSTARFSESLLSKKDDDLYHIDKVIGPDEYHELVNDNVYTNIMVQYNLDIAVKLYDQLNEKYKAQLEKLKEKLNLQNEEIELWKNIKDKIYLDYDFKSKLYEQFKGYFSLKYIDLKQYEPRTLPMDVILGRERTRESQVIKQPDVLMFMLLLANKFSQDVIEANYNYYEPRTSHGSSLSPGIHGIIAARLGKTDEAYKYFKQSAEVDLYNSMGNAYGGIHMATMGSIWMLMVMGFGGMYLYDKGLMFDPHLPEHFEQLEFSVFHNRQKLNIQINQDEIEIELIGNKKVNISVGADNWKEIQPNNIYSAYKVHKWYWK